MVPGARAAIRGILSRHTTPGLNFRLVDSSLEMQIIYFGPTQGAAKQMVLQRRNAAAAHRDLGLRIVALHGVNDSFSN